MSSVVELFGHFCKTYLTEYIEKHIIKLRRKDKFQTNFKKANVHKK